MRINKKVRLYKILKRKKAYLAGLFFLTISSGCTTETLYSPNDDDADFSAVTSMKVKLYDSSDSNNNFEDRIGDLKIFLFKGTPEESNYLAGIADAKKLESSEDIYGVTFNGVVPELPAFIMAIANTTFPVTEIGSLHDLLKRENEICTSDKGLMMSNAIYFDENNNCFYYSLIEEENIAEQDPEPVPVFLERNVVKAMVFDKRESQEINTELAFKGEPVKLRTVFTGWGINNTDKKTFLIKNIDGLSYEELKNELGCVEESLWCPEVEGEGFRSLQWSHSSGYSNSNNFTDNDIERSEKDVLSYDKLKGEFSTDNKDVPLYVNETTCSEETFEMEGAVPTLIIGAVNYINDSREAFSFFVKEGKIFSEEDYWNYVASVQDAIYYKDQPRIKVTAVDLRKICNLSTLENYSEYGIYGWNKVCVQLKEGTGLGNYADYMGNPFSSDPQIEASNLRLLESIGDSEFFYEGKSIYSVPVQHFSVQREEDFTGKYGLVRNNSYLFNVTSVNNIGSGIPSEEADIHETAPTEMPAYRLGINVSVTPWIKVESETNF